MVKDLFMQYIFPKNKYEKSSIETDLCIADTHCGSARRN